MKTYDYDSLGHLYIQSGPGGPRRDYRYDANGNLTRFIDPYGSTGYVFDAANRLTQIIGPSGSGSCPTGTGSPANSGCVKLGYDNANHETSRTLPGNATITTSRDASGRATRITATNGTGTPVADIGYSYTTAGSTGPSADRTDVQTRTSYRETGIPAGAITGYGYDSLNRLITATENNGPYLNASWAYSYDGAGNRTRQVRAGNTGTAAGTIAYTYDNANRLSATTADTTGWTYDAAGNQTRNGITGQTATYNTRDATSTIGSSTLTAFGQGNTEQLKRSVDGNNYISSALGLIFETPGTSTVSYTRTTTGTPVSMQLDATARYYYAADQLGSTLGLFDSTGNWVGGYTYSPYGESRTTDTATPITINNLRYIGGYHDTPSGLYKLGARYYDPSLGRFTQTDPSGQEANPYAYASCNPINASDPTGLRCIDIVNAGLSTAFLGLLTAAGSLSIDATVFGIPVGVVVGGLGLTAALFGSIAVVGGLICLVFE